MWVYQSKNSLVSYQLSSQVAIQLQRFNEQIDNQHLKHTMPIQIIDRLLENFYEARQIIIGVSNDALMIESAQRFKHQLESYLHHHNIVPYNINVVIWKENAKNMKKFESAFVDNDPDLWLIFSKPFSFGRLLKRLYRNPKFDPTRTFCMSNFCSHDLMQVIGYKYFEGITGLSPMGRAWCVQSGELELLSS